MDFSYTNLIKTSICTDWIYFHYFLVQFTFAIGVIGIFTFEMIHMNMFMFDEQTLQLLSLAGAADIFMIVLILVVLVRVLW